MKILFVAYDGIGNIIQAIPTIRTLAQKHEVSLATKFTSYDVPLDLCPYAMPHKPGAKYDLVVGTKPQEQVCSAPLSPHVPEVECHMEIAKALNVAPVQWHGTCNYTPSDKYYDVVLHDGYNRKSSCDWSVKSYPMYKFLGIMLERAGYSVASVGLKEDYTYGANLTGVPLLETFGIIKNAKLLIGNDSSLYHAANALGTPNIVIFTATSTIKNYYPAFHKHATVIVPDLTCAPCQAGRRWLNDCDLWRCRYIEPGRILEHAYKNLTCSSI